MTGYLRKDYNKKSISISTDKFKDALNGTRFEGADFYKVLELYFGESILTKKDEQQSYIEKREEFFKDIQSSVEGVFLQSWFKYVFDTKKNAYNVLIKKYEEDKSQLKEDLIMVGKAFLIITNHCNYLYGT